MSGTFPATLAKAASEFFPDSHWVGGAALGDGNINDTYRIDLEGKNTPQHFVLQRINSAVFPSPKLVMENLRLVTEHLSQQPDYPYAVLRPLPAPSGLPYWQDNEGQYWRAFAFLGAAFSPDKIASPQQAYVAAQAYGAFAFALRNLPVARLTETISGFHDTDQRWAAFEEVLYRDPVLRAHSVQNEVARLREAKSIFDHISHLKQSGQLPLRVTHNDTKAGNVLLHRETGQALAVIDLDTVMPGTVLSDFGDMARTFVPDRYEDDPATEDIHLRTDVLQALSEGYLKETAAWLSPAERAHLMTGAKWIVGEQALRFFTDYLSGDTYYKVRYAEHNLVRTRNQLKVLDLLIAVS